MSVITSKTDQVNDEISNGDILSDEEMFSRIDPGERILLISHCLRISSVCKAKSGPGGMTCMQCNESCQVNQLQEAAMRFGYKGVCIAPGGSLAMKYVKENTPEGIIAVACRMELQEGIDSVRDYASGSGISAPPIVIVPLTRDGCVDTEVDIDFALEKISTGCEQKKDAKNI